MFGLAFDLMYLVAMILVFVGLMKLGKRLEHSNEYARTLLGKMTTLTVAIEAHTQALQRATDVTGTLLDGDVQEKMP